MHHNVYVTEQLMVQRQREVERALEQQQVVAASRTSSGLRVRVQSVVRTLCEHRHSPQPAVRVAIPLTEPTGRSCGQTQAIGVAEGWSTAVRS